MQSSKPIKSPLLWVPSAYFTMGLTYMALTGASAIMFKNLGMDNGRAAEYASYLILAYTIKPLFSPFIDMYRTKKFFVLIFQCLIGACFAAAALALGLPDPVLALMACFWLISFLGAGQDIATDGVYITALSGKAQSLYCGVQSLSWNLAPVVVSGGLVYLSGMLHSDVFGHDPAPGPAWADAWRVILLIIAGLTLLAPLWHWRQMPDGARAEHSPANARQAMTILADAFANLFRKRGIWLMIAFSLLYRLTPGMLDKVGPFFMVDPVSRGGLGLSNEMLGLVYGTYGLAAVVLGALLGGWFVARRGLRPSLFWLCCAVNIPNVAFLLLAWYQPSSLALICLGVVIDKFFFGFGAVGFNIYLMQQLAPGRYSTTTFAFATGLFGLSQMLTGAVSGHLQTMLGYTSYFALVMAMMIPSFLATWLAPFHQPEEHSDPQAGQPAARGAPA